MIVLSGSVLRFLHAPNGQVNGIVFEQGLETRFPPEQSSKVMEVAAVGSRLKVCGRMRSTAEGEIVFELTAITNVDSKHSVNLEKPLPPNGPEVPPNASLTPGRAAPLDSPESRKWIAGTQSSRLQNLGSESFGLGSELVLPDKRRFTSHIAADELPDRASASWRNREDAACMIERAYDGLHRTQALLAYLTIVNLKGPGIGQLLDEAKHTYEQALSHYQKREFKIAREFAAASTDLSHAVGILITRTLHSDEHYPTLVPPPPSNRKASNEVNRAQEDLGRVEYLLSRIQWVMENGVLSNDDLQQLHKITSMSKTLYTQARKSLRHGATEDAIELANAAYAGVHSAVHICRKCCASDERDASFSAMPASQHP